MRAIRCMYMGGQRREGISGDIYNAPSNIIFILLAIINFILLCRMHVTCFHVPFSCLTMLLSVLDLKRSYSAIVNSRREEYQRD